jgi:hypothetical protein
MEEVQDMTDVLLGRVEPPINADVATLMEVADAYFARAMEIIMLIQTAEREGKVTRGSGYAQLRTKELRTFAEIAKRSSDMGSRRITMMQMQLQAEMTGRTNFIDG